MKLLYLLFFIAFSMNASAQDASWKITHNGKTRLSATSESEEKNKVQIRTADLKKKGAMVVNFLQKEKQAGWSRFIAVYDGQDNELLQSKGSTMKMDNAKLLSLLRKNNKLRIFTWALPDDPELAARIRIRRVHLVTIELRK